MTLRLVPGQLVEITGMHELVQVQGGKEARMNLNGHMAQLMCFFEEKEMWALTTVGRHRASVKEQYLRPLTTFDVKAFDVALGPHCKMDLVGQTIAEHLQECGHVRLKLFMAAEDLRSLGAAAHGADAEGLFRRLPRELEQGYLGKDGKGKTLSIASSQERHPDVFLGTNLAGAETSITGVGEFLGPYTHDFFGFNIASRSDTFLMLPFTSPSDEESYEPDDVDSAEASQFLKMMWRAKLMVVVNLGPGDSTLTLFPKLPSDCETRMEVAPGTMTLFAVDRYKFSYSPGPDALTMMCWFLDEERQFNIDPTPLNGHSLSSLALFAPTGPQPKSLSEPVQVVSISTRYAAGMDHVGKLWLAYAKMTIDAFTEIPVKRWDLDIYYDAEADASSNKHYTKHGCFNETIELFDNKLFEISPAEAAGMDVCQRQALEVCYSALNGGGYQKKDLSRKPENIGVFIGMDKNEWSNVAGGSGGALGASNAAPAIVSNRVNFSLNLKGPSMTMDTACSSSLVATHTAKLYLYNNKYDPSPACIAGGVNSLVSPFTYISCCAAGMLSRKGRCFTYSSSAEGYARGESFAAICLKPKKFSREDGDYAQIVGSHVNQDGRSASLTAPSGPSQEKCNRAVLREANMSPADVDAMECHGTGTALGDPIEIGALAKVIASAKRTTPLCVTSSKSNIGHSEGNAGLSGFIKTVLMVGNGEATPNCHFNMMNAHLDVSTLVGHIPTESYAACNDNTFVGVLSFGFGGTNASSQVWGTNISTSRCSANRNPGKVLMAKIRNAPLPEVAMVGEDWEDWDMSYPRQDGKDSDEYQVEVDEETGELSYTKVEPEEKHLGSFFALSGTFNDWESLNMAEDSQLVGLYAATIQIGSSGEELFQVVADGDSEMTYFPETQRCTRKSSPVSGPAEQADRQNAWCICGSPGDRFRVELYRSEGDRISISWLKQR